MGKRKLINTERFYQKLKMLQYPLTDAYLAYKAWKPYKIFFPKSHSDVGIFIEYYDGPMLSINLYFFEICWCSVNGTKIK